MNQYDNGGQHNDRNNNGYRGNGNGGNGGGQPPRKPGLVVLILAGLGAVLMAFLFWNTFMGTMEKASQVPYTEFLEYLYDGKVESVEVQSTGTAYFTMKQEESSAEQSDDTVRNPLLLMNYDYQPTYSTVVMEDLTTLTNRLKELNDQGYEIEGNYEPDDGSGQFLQTILTFILPLVLMWVLLGFMFRKMGGSGGGGGGIMGVGKSNAKVYVQKETGVTFKDVAGEDEAKESLQEVVDFLHNPGKYAQIGAKLPKGALLVGPPGTGKTLLARAVAGEAHVPFFSLTGSDFVEMFVGVGASRVRDLFKEATKNAPCIIFIDEIDAIGRSRDSKFGGGNEEREQTLNQLLSEMDGFDSSKGILILAATNRPEILDKALLRPGRFDRRIIVDKPDLRGRVEILKVHAKDVKMDETVDLDAIALATSGAVGSDLANMINEAAINAVKEGRQYVNQHDLFNAVEQVLVGKEKKDRIMSKEERRIVSYHEVGHALISALQKNSEPVQKITIVPRTMGALGYVMHVPEEEKYLNTEAELRDMLVGLVGGRAAEEVVFDTVTTGAANDIERATEIARSMVTRFGMSKRFGLVGLATVESQYLDGRAALNCSDKTAAEVDAEVVEILKESYEKALELLRENRGLMDKLADYLIEKETITGKEFMAIFRKEKGLPEPEVKEEEKAESKPAEETVKAEAAEQAAEAAEKTAEPMPAEVSGTEEAPSEALRTESVTEEAAEETSREEQVCEETAQADEASQQEASRQQAQPGNDRDDRPRGLFSKGTIDEM